ncbi:MAG: TetR family transcriptional regulator [Prevotellaceae bacterium]|jgi:AcrR family transcriptional regulator|nr:TetR family transcriptional regulator [Prevotellaceae bacterium]
MAEDIVTKDKIKDAALKLFQQKGFAGTKTRDIAIEAGTNVALLNYYFSSKEKLCEIVMEESLRKVFLGLEGAFRKSTVEEKLESIVNNYFDILLKNPDLPLFVFREIQAGATGFFDKSGISPGLISQSTFVKQLGEELNVKNPLQIMLNILALVIFPFIAKPIWMRVADMDENGFTAFVEERRTLIPAWVKLLINTESK